MNQKAVNAIKYGAAKLVNGATKRFTGGKIFGPITVRDGERLAIWGRVK